MRTKTPAFVSLLVVILTGAIGVAIVVSVLGLGIGAARDGLAGEQSGKAKELAVACVEHALEYVRSSTAYLGNDNLSLGSGSCTYAVTDLGGESRQVIATGTVGTVVRKLTVVIAAINPTIIISSWQETP